MEQTLPAIIGDGIRVAIEAAPTGVVIADMSRPDAPLVYANPAFHQMTGYDPDEIVGRNCRFLQGPDTNPDAVEAIRSAVHDMRTITIRLLNYRKDRSSFWNELTLSPVIAEDHGMYGFVGIQKDVTAEVEAQRHLVDRLEVLEATRKSLEEARRDLQNLAQVDGLTGLASRRLFFDRLTMALARGQRSGDPVGIVVMDLDGFKAVNDCHGHQTGDRALRAAAARMRSQCRQSDTLARLGGDEFVLLMESGVSDLAAREVCRRLAGTFDSPFDLGDGTAELSIELGVSLGVALFPDDGQSGSDLIRTADARMYETKARQKAAHGQIGGDIGGQSQGLHG